MPETKHQVNVQLDEEEMNALTAICERECIKKPVTLVGIWIREKLRANSDFDVLLGVVREAQADGVDVEKVLRRARRAK